MPIGRRKRGSNHIDHWPGYVDVLSTLLLVITFLLSIFVLVQFFTSQETSNKDSALNKLNSQIAELTNLLSLEQKKTRGLDDRVSSLSVTLETSQNENKRLLGLLGEEGEKGKSAGSQVTALSNDLAKQKEVSASALAQVELLNQQLLALRRQIASLQSALDASEKKDQDSQAKISDLGNRLNLALAKKVQQLEQYKSDFFGRLRNVLGTRENITMVGDRFVFQAEVLFPSGSDEINPAGKTELTKLADVLKQLEKDIPAEVNWVLRIDGHTDIRPIATPRFPTNWELSSARAISVVKFLMANGVQSKRLVAAGFGDNQPLVQGSTNDALTKNRRIELKFTER